MSDARLREVSRNAALGDQTARDRLLLERVRAGELSAERVRLTAWLGESRALAIVGPGVLRPPSAGLRAWLLDLTVFGTREAVIRALACVGSSQLAKAGVRIPVADGAVAAVRRCFEHPGPEAVAAAKAAARLASAISAVRRWIEQPKGC